MNNEKTLMIVEGAQVPQVVTASDVSAAEIEYQRLHKEFKVVVDQLLAVEQHRALVKTRLMEAWFAENYPEVSITVTPDFEVQGYQAMRFDHSVSIDSPRRRAIFDECMAYLAQLEA